MQRLIFSVTIFTEGTEIVGNKDIFDIATNIANTLKTECIAGKGLVAPEAYTSQISVTGPFSVDAVTVNILD